MMEDLGEPLEASVYGSVRELILGDDVLGVDLWIDICCFSEIEHYIDMVMEGVKDLSDAVPR